MRYQRSATRSRVIPFALRSQHDPKQSHVRHQNKSHWSTIWIVASLLSLIVLGVILATHC